MLIQDPAERRARAEQKRRAILRFLRDELYTTPQVIGLLLNCAERGTRATLAAMERDGLLKRHEIKIMPQLPPVVIVGITAQGQGEAYDPDAGEQIRLKAFEPSRVDLKSIQHTVDTQALRIQSADRWRQWVSTDRLAAALAGAKKPDAVALTASGERVAIECERHVKTRQRYETFFAGHLTAIRQRKWSRVVIAAPDEDKRRRIADALATIKTCSVQGERIKVDDATRALFKTCTYDTFPNQL